MHPTSGDGDLIQVFAYASYRYRSWYLETGALYEEGWAGLELLVFLPHIPSDGL